MGVDIATPEAGSTTGGLTRDAILQGGQRFVLKERGSGKFLIAVGQSPVLQACDDMSALPNMWHWHWDCVMTHGWVTLRNRITENYLGADLSNARRVFVLRVAPRAGAFTGYLVVTRSSGGGQTLSAPYKQDIRQIVEIESKQALGLGTTEGLEWEFIRVEP
ncbi:hypothetical protein E4U22_003084 [Claviceps purpurea]|nr:hypothetical protein E4U10_006516 [Claviceps purpurea]KAG6310767.1 hypothetical protein E4U22_003084 [Claviceps purpurea]